MPTEVPTTCRRLRGGYRALRVLLPGESIPGYLTEANGSADEIAPASGEIAVCLSMGSPLWFASWIAGPAQDVIAWLRQHPGDDNAGNRLADAAERRIKGANQ